MGDIGRMFNPKSVALVGASDKPASFGRAILHNLLRGAGGAFSPSISGRRASSASPPTLIFREFRRRLTLRSLPLRQRTVPSLVEECGKAGVEGVIIVSSGFRETGAEGQRLEEEIADVRKKYPMRILGPNCLGLIRPHIGLNATPLASNPLEGNTAFISPSGAFGRALIEWGISSVSASACSFPWVRWSTWTWET